MSERWFDRERQGQSVSARALCLLACAALLLGCRACERSPFVPPELPTAAPVATTPAPNVAPSPAAPARKQRLVAYVNCLCGFGVGASAGACAAQPDPNVNQIKAWEASGASPITHYAIAFLSFKGDAIVSDGASIWASGGGSATDFVLDDHLRAALRVAKAHGKSVLLSLGGEAGSSTFLEFWRARGKTSQARVDSMRSELGRVIAAFEQQNRMRVDGIDVDVELGGRYVKDSDAYVSIRDLIAAVPDEFQVAFAPQIGNGLCAAPSLGDSLGPEVVLRKTCRRFAGSEDSAWAIAQLDRESRRADGGPKLDYIAIQYYNEGDEPCCGGGHDENAMVISTAQHYTNLANGWAASGDIRDAKNPWHASAQKSGGWPAFGGIGAERLVLGKPACKGCADDAYLGLGAMQTLLARLDGRLHGAIGGVMFWDLCRLFGDKGGLCIGESCEPSWREQDPRASLTTLKHALEALKPATPAER